MHVRHNAPREISADKQRNTFYISSGFQKLHYPITLAFRIQTSGTMRHFMKAPPPIVRAISGAWLFRIWRLPS